MPLYIDQVMSAALQQGPQGAQGVQGNPGGAQGVQGSQGVQGAQGTAANNTVLEINTVEEQFLSLSSANGTFVHDCTNAHVFVHSSIAASFTANFTNLNLNNNYATSITLVLNQGGTAYVANAVQIGGSSQTVNWQGSSSPPTGNANKKDIQTFSIINSSGTYTVLGQLTSFG